MPVDESKNGYLSTRVARKHSERGTRMKNRSDSPSSISLTGTPTIPLSPTSQQAGHSSIAPKIDNTEVRTDRQFFEERR